MLLFLLLSCYLRVPDPAGAHIDQQRRFYEGWYLRVTDTALGESLGLIWGIAHLPGQHQGGEAYLIVLSAADDRAVWGSAPLTEVRTEAGLFDVQLGERGSELHGRLTATSSAGRLEQEGTVVAWDLDIEAVRGWERSGRDSPMGWVLRWRGFQTYWHVEELQARVSGALRFGDRVIELDDAQAYVEKNWGRVFPRDWMWLQAGSFVDAETGEPRDAALSASGGHVPVLGPIGPRAGIVGWFDGEQLYHFATHTGQRVRMEAVPGRWEVVARGGGDKVVIRGEVAPERLVPIVGPTPDGVQEVAIESLGGRVEVERWERGRPFGRWRQVDAATSELAGVEVGGAGVIAGD